MEKKLFAAGDLEVFQTRCELCDDPLPLNIHKLRKFCPHKYGYNNWCKEKMKELRGQQRVMGEDPPTTLKTSLGNLKLRLLNEPLKSSEEPQPIITVKTDAEKLQKHESNVNIIKSFLGDQEDVLVSLEKMLKAQYDFTTYDAKNPFPDGNYFYNEIDDFAIIWYKSNSILLSKSIQFTCLY